MAIKKYTNGSWVSASYRKYGTETDAITTLPTTVIGDGTPISTYTIKGNMEQNGTPTPSSPIYPSECGEKTENLLYLYKEGYALDDRGNEVENSEFSIYQAFVNIDKIQYILTGTAPALRYIRVHEFINNTWVRQIVVAPGNQLPLRLTKSPNSNRLLISINNNNNNMMLAVGSTAPTSYIPYGYKLPLTLGGTTTNIYLGEVQSTRRIKKLVLTGEENWHMSIYYNGSAFVYLYDITPNAVPSSPIVCTHVDQQSGEYHYGQGRIDANSLSLWLFNSSVTLADFKAFLAQQYANGTPVTVWYVLAEPETAVVNEPLMKIGDYVDSVSGTGLATSGTAQEFDVGTTLKPSEVDLTYHGWHEHDDTKYST